MNKNETKKLLTVLSSAYQKFTINTLSVNVWLAALGHLEFSVIEIATIRLIQTLQFPPTPADIIREVSLLQNHGNDIDSSTAWGLTIQAIRNFGAYNEKGGLETLPCSVRNVVKNFGWRELCLSENIDVVRGEFLKMYASYRTREIKNNALPPISQEMKQLIDGIG